MNEKNGIPFSIEFLLDKLKNVDRKICMSNLKDYDFKKFNTGQAFMSEIVQANFKWKEPTSLNSVILKIPGFQQLCEDQDTEQATKFLEYAHERECDFYRLFSTSVIPIRLPKFYYGYPYSRHHKDGLMILEDLSEIACTVKMLPGFTNAQVEELIVELAKIHAVSLLDRSWFDKLSLEVHEMEGFIMSTKTCAYELKDIKPEWFNEVLEELAPIYDMKYYYQTMYTGTKYGIPACIVHADLWSANVLWRKDQNGEATSRLEAIIDWQMCYAGNPAADIARALCFNTSSKYRHENEERLLELYHKTINKAMNGKAPFSIEQLVEAYKASFPYVASVAGFGAPMYYQMKSIVGDPHNSDLQNELLDRVYSFFKDTVEIIKAEK